VRNGTQRLAGVIGSLPRELTIALVVTIVATAISLVTLLTKHKAHVLVVALAALVAFLVGLVCRAALGGTSDDDGHEVDDQRT
jgi:cobalamin synthase